MEALIEKQVEIASSITKLKNTFGKGPDGRFISKTPQYIALKLESLDNLWIEYGTNNERILEFADRTHIYFTENIFARTKEYYTTFRKYLSTIVLDIEKVDKSTEMGGSTPNPLNPNVSSDHDQQLSADSLSLSQQRTNFRAFQRMVRSINVDEISAKWELEDELKNIQARWKTIDNLHLRIDNILQGEDIVYDQEFSTYEKMYKDINRSLNTKLSATVHTQQSTPKIDIPVFSGNITQWPTFFDLYTEAIHNNMNLTNAQKMQHLKTKMKGEAERLISQYHVTDENYAKAWKVLTHRYANKQAIFTNQIEKFLNQPLIRAQSSHEIKQLHDVTQECIHAFHNLGVDTSTWDPFLVHVVTKKLDPVTYTDYKEARRSPRELPDFKELMEFLECKFSALEPILPSESELTSSKTSTSTTSTSLPTKNDYYPGNKSGKFFKKNYQASATYTSHSCALCNNHDHQLYKCKRFANMSPETKLRSLMNNNICINCLYKHNDKPCVSTKRCKTCMQPHNSIVHDAFANSAASTTAPQTSSPTSTKPSNKQRSVNHVAADDEETLLTTVTIQVKRNDGTYVKLRALLDQGSQISLLSENAAQMLGLQRRSYHASVSGIGTGSKQSKGMVTMHCSSIYQDYQFTTQALVINRVINDLPNQTFGTKPWEHLQHIKLADPEYNVSRTIDMLLDASVYSDIIMSGLIKGPSRAPIAQQTKLGWILSGNVKTFNCHVVLNDLTEISKYWEVEDISSSSSTLSSEEQLCEDFYQATTKRLDSGRYEVGIPMKPDFEEQLGLSKPKAVAQFKQIEQKMVKNEALSESYKAFMAEYQSLNHMRPVLSSTEPVCFLPHHGVLKLDSTTTKLRVVFNGSSKTTSGKSLNDLMGCGPNLQADLLTLIIRWRQHKYVITADIEKMFRQILIREQDQPLQSIIWRDSPQDPLQHYQLTTVTYGTKAAPYLAIRTLHQLARDDADKYPLAAAALENSFFMDDLLSGHNSKEQTIELQRQLIQMLQEAGMNLRKWSSNDPDIINHLSAEQRSGSLEFKCAETRKTLGLQWKPSADAFTFQNTLTYQENNNTKRQLLSSISKVFDPLGWLSPLTIRAKLLFQKAWTSGLSWDETVPENILQEWKQISDDFRGIDNYTISRHFGDTEQPYQLHGFCDASEKAYACVIYIVTRNPKGGFTSRLVAAKTKLAPLNKQVSLPRLELCSAVLLSQLMAKVTETLSAKNITTYAWTDSMIALGWLKGDVGRWKQFVANRVQQITAIIPSSSWRHVRSEENAADCATRGLTTAQLSEHSLWWQGPDWLPSFDPTEYTNEVSYQTPTEEEKKFKATVTIQQEISLAYQLLQEHSSMTKVVRILAWISRFITNTSSNKNALQIGALTSSEISKAYNLICKDIQGLDFPDGLAQLKSKGLVHKTSKLSCLNPYLDEHGLIRVGGRLNNSRISVSAKHPIILSNHGRLTELIINQAHIATLHGGPRLTLSYIRERFWIISGIRTVKRQLRQCVKCRRYSGENQQQIMGDLPQPRVTPSRPFTHTGIDFTGFVELKCNRGRGIRTSKGYIAVFVCLSTKAVHLELVSDMSTPTFLAAIHRFRARRSTPRHIYSDNGTNLVGANRVLKREYQEILQCINQDLLDDIANMDITWHFNAPAWPSAGGLWESAVKSLKYHLKRVLGEQKLTYEEFTTLLHQIEACLNSRPLCALTEDSDDSYLTPGHFLVGGPLITRPQWDAPNITLTTRWQLVQAINKQFWKHWSAEYLQQLQVRSKWRTPSKNLETEDMVLIKEDNMPPGKWALGRVMEVHPGRDGNVRVVSLKARNRLVKRPINKLVLLPVNDSSASDAVGNSINQQPRT